MMDRYQELQELRKAFLDTYEQKDWNLAMTIQEEILQIHQNDEQVGTEDVAREMHNLGVVLQEMESWEKAKSCYERAANAKRMCRGATLSLADTLNNLGIVYYKMGEFDECLEAYEEVLAIQNRYLDKDDSERIQTLRHLGNGYEAVGAYEKAVLMLQEVLLWGKRKKQYSKIELAGICGELALCQKRVGEYKKGIYNYNMALFWLEREGVVNSLRNLKYLWELSGLYDAAGYGDLAVECGEKAVILAEKRSQGDELFRGLRMNEFAVLCKKNGAYDTAIKWHEMALVRAQKKLGVDHLEYRKIEVRLAIDYFGKAMAQEAEKADNLQMAVEILEHVMRKNPNADGIDLVQSLEVAGLLAKVEHERGNHAKDMEYLKHMALDLFWKVDIEEEGALEAVLLVAGLLYETGIHEGALYCVERVLNSAKKNDSCYVEALYMMGEIWEKYGWKEGQVAVGQIAKTITEELYPPNHPEVAKSWKRLGIAYGKTEDFAEANKYFVKALKLEEQALDQDSPILVETLMGLAEIAFWQGRYEDSIAYLKERNDLNPEKTKEGLLEAAVSLISIGVAYLAMGDEKTADAYKIEGEKKLENSTLAAPAIYQQQQKLYEKLQNDLPIQYGEETKSIPYEEVFLESQYICKNLENVLQIIQEKGEPISTRNTFMANCIAGIYHDCEQYHEALQWYQLAEKWGEDDDYLKACLAVGHMHLHLGEFDKALRQFINAKEYILEYRDMEVISLCVISGYIADAYVGIGDEYLALQAYIGWERKCRQLHIAQGVQYRKRILCGAELLEKAGNNSLAVSWYEKYRDALKSCCPRGEEYARVQLKLVELLMFKELPETCVKMLDEILAMGNAKKRPSQPVLSPEIFDKLGQLYFTLEKEEKCWEALVLAYEGSKLVKQTMSKEGLWLFFRLLQEKQKK